MSRPEVYFRPSEIADAFAIAKDLRQCDRDELSANSSKPYDQVLFESISMSLISWTAVVNGVPAAVFGVCPISLLNGWGCPWFLATTEADKFPVMFLKFGRVYLRELLEAFPYLENHVDSRNTKSIRWLKRLGFRFDAAEPNEYSGIPFHRFFLVGDLCVKS